MSPFETAVASHLAGTVVLALFFVLLGRHDPRPYLRAWAAAWVTQVVALAALLLSARQGWHLSYSLYLLLETAHGVLLCLAALAFARGPALPRWWPWAFAPLVAWAAAGPALLPDTRHLHAAQFAALAATYVAAATFLWPRRRQDEMGLRITTNVLALLSLLYLHYAAVFRLAFRGTEGAAYLEVAPFAVLLLQMLLALGMVLAVTEAAQRTLAATNAQLREAEERLRLLAETDPLTGCSNRRVFRELVDELRRRGPAASGVVLLLDMDGLKAVNDLRGHAAGDEAIRGVATAIRSRTREGRDLVVRWGGDEFVVVLPAVTREEGEARRLEIKAAVGAAGYSASAGLAAFGEGTDIVRAVEQADATMYAEKAARRSFAARGSPAGDRTPAGRPD